VVELVVEFISRKELGWPASAAPQKTRPTKGVKIHYEGTPVSVQDHSHCKAHWTSIRNSHLANKAEGYSDVAYNFAVCRHGTVMEGRGIGFRTGANGDQTLNANHESVCVLYGTNDKSVSSAVTSGVRWVIQYLRDHGTGTEIKGHRDGYPTACPGEPLYALVKSGKFEPVKEDDVTPADIDKIATAVAKKIFSVDGLIPAGSVEPDKNNKFWAFKTHLVTVTNTVARLEKALAELSKRVK
jgi:hypothetical protein